MEKTDEKIVSMQIVCFKVGSEDYGLEILKVQEIIKIPHITKLPQSASYITGVIDLRGKVVPIVDLAKRFGVESGDSSKNTRVIIVDIKGRRIGLAIDSVSNVTKINAKDLGPPPPIIKGISGRYIVGIGKVDTGFIVILDIDQIFSSEELQAL